jgi:hypothetical protein
MYILIDNRQISYKSLTEDFKKYWADLAKNQKTVHLCFVF